MASHACQGNDGALRIAIGHDMSVDRTLTQLGIVLPSPPAPVGTYVPAVRSGNLLFLSGVIPIRNNKLVMAGKLGKELTTEQGYEAARIALINALAIVHRELGGLDAVTRIIRLVGYVASSGGFTQQPAVINGASDLLVEVFGEAGRHARIAVGAAELPLNAPVELELILQVK
jgi:enamine deaminase RidA (YjgF/YER057c/UK114 family)